VFVRLLQVVHRSSPVAGHDYILSLPRRLIDSTLSDISHFLSRRLTGVEQSEHAPSLTPSDDSWKHFFLTLQWHIKTTEQRTIIHQYSDWDNGRCWVDCNIWYSEGPGRAHSSPAHSPPRCTKCNSPPINQLHII